MAAVTLGLLGGESIRGVTGGKSREAGAASEALGLQGRKEERGEREGDREARKILKMALGPGRGSAMLWLRPP